MPGTPDSGQRRVIFLTGSPRSGTTWLANILNAHRQVVYSHEPFSKLRIPNVEPILQQLKTTGSLEPEKCATLIREWSRAYPVIRRPPFFAKDFINIPPTLMWMIWSLVQVAHCGDKYFCHLCSPTERDQYDLLVKEVGGPEHTTAIIRALDPELIVIFRHPYAVIASILKGRRLGLLSHINRAVWLRHSSQFCQQLGFDQDHILRMEECEFLALRWVVVNMVYQDMLQKRARSVAVVYEDLCTDPHGVTASVFRFLNWEMDHQTTRFLEESTREKKTWLRSLWHSGDSYFGIYKESRQSSGLRRAGLTHQEKARVASIVKPFSFPYWAGQEPWT